MGKIIYIPTQCFNIPSGKVERTFVGTPYLKLDGVRYQKWKSDRVIVFQSVILQHAQGVNNAKNICARILF